MKSSGTIRQNFPRYLKITTKYLVGSYFSSIFQTAYVIYKGKVTYKNREKKNPQLFECNVKRCSTGSSRGIMGQLTTGSVSQVRSASPERSSNSFFQLCAYFVAPLQMLHLLSIWFFYSQEKSLWFFVQVSRWWIVIQHSSHIAGD